MCSVEIRAGRVWVWFIHPAILSAATIDFNLASVQPPLYSTTCLASYFRAEFVLPCTLHSYSITMLLGKKKKKVKSMQFVNQRKETPQLPTLDQKATLGRLQ